MSPFVSGLVVLKSTEEQMSGAGDFQQCGILTSVDSDEPVQPPFKLKNSK